MSPATGGPLCCRAQLSQLDRAYEGKPLDELADAPVAALQGVSASDAEHLKAAPTGRLTNQ
jgi:hypothetical protein